MFKLARKYIVFYKSQSLAILVSMILSIALMTGISSLVYSGQLSDLQNSKEINGDWNYAVPLKDNTIEKITNKQDKGYKVENMVSVKLLMKQSVIKILLYCMAMKHI